MLCLKYQEQKCLCSGADCVSQVLVLRPQRGCSVTITPITLKLCHANALYWFLRPSQTGNVASSIYAKARCDVRISRPLDQNQPLAKCPNYKTTIILLLGNISRSVVLVKNVLCQIFSSFNAN